MTRIEYFIIANFIGWQHWHIRRVEKVIVINNDGNKIFGYQRIKTVKVPTFGDNVIKSCMEDL